MNMIGVETEDSCQGVRKGPDRRGWLLVVASALALAVFSWVTNITTDSQIAGEADDFLTLRYTFSKLANSGTAWAGLMILCGWLVRRPFPAVIAAIFGSLLSLAAHYAVGRTTGMFDATVWTENRDWFVVALLFGAPLGLVGAAARRTDMWGWCARLVVPLGAMLEPFVMGMFTPSPLRTGPDRLAEMASGVILIVLGAAGGAVIVRHDWRL